MSKNRGKIVLGIILIVTAIAIKLNQTAIIDTIIGFTYSASPEVSALRDSLELTGTAARIFNASRPELESHEKFNEHCDSHNQEITVLGCFDGERIYLYDVKSEELSGIVESTAAHELLHAIWDRTDSAEKPRVSTLLVDVYNDEKYHTLLAEDLEIYEDAEMIDELHSRIGTEIADLPAELETYYAQFFKDQNEIVAFYDRYIEPFHELSDEIDRLSSELETLNTEIEEKSAEYYRQAETLSAEIDNFNACAETEGCFSSDAVFNNRRAALVRRQHTLDDRYDEIEDLIEKYNTLVEEYNTNILRNNTLEEAINSNLRKEINE